MIQSFNCVCWAAPLGFAVLQDPPQPEFGTNTNASPEKQQDNTWSHFEERATNQSSNAGFVSLFDFAVTPFCRLQSRNAVSTNELSQCSKTTMKQNNRTRASRLKICWQKRKHLVTFFQWRRNALRPCSQSALLAAAHLMCDHANHGRFAFVKRVIRRQLST